ncbi:MAG: TetR/AcrR family transcriptional regulator [Actinomycetota bacterium]|nr:TetR/AcrR family transcriptional regulator [Actinomycetota bacterium]
MEQAADDYPRSRPPGRPRSERARRAILQAANELLESEGFASVTVEAIAERAGVSKATVYRWWPNKAAVVMDGFLSTVSSEAPFPHTDSAQEDIRLHMRRLTKALGGKMGRTVAALVAEGQADPELTEALHSRWLSVRRAEVKEILEQGMARGELRGGLDLEVAVDSLYGPIYYRLLVSHASLEEDFTDTLADHVFAGLSAQDPA